jgi:predicted CoA-binding protein
VTPNDLLRDARTILLVDFPSRDVPDTLAGAGYVVVASVGPGPDGYMAYELDGGQIVTRHASQPPNHADIVYSHRPIDELPEIVALARMLGAKAVWCETDSTDARRIVEGAGLVYAGESRIMDAVRLLRPRQ